MGFPGSSTGKESTCKAGGDPSSIPGLGRSPGEGHGIPLQYSCLENPVDRGAWQTIVQTMAKSRAQLKQLSMYFAIDGFPGSSAGMQETLVQFLGQKDSLEKG